MSEIAEAMEQMPFEDWYRELVQIHRERDYEFPDDEDAWRLYWEDFYSPHEAFCEDQKAGL